jgi:hypothetical protein
VRTQHVPASVWRITLDNLSRAYDGAIGGVYDAHALRDPKPIYSGA